MYNLSLKTKLTLVVSLLMAVILSLLGYCALRYFETSIKEKIFAWQYSTASTAAALVDAHILGEKDQIVSLSKYITPMILSNPDELHKIFGNLTAIKSRWAEDYSIFSIEGNIIESTDRSAIGTKVEREIFKVTKKALKNKTLQISEPYLDSFQNKDKISFVIPILGATGGVKAFLTSDFTLNLDTFLWQINHLRLPGGGYLYVFDCDGYFIAHPDKSRIGTNLKHGVNKMFDKALEGFEGSGETINSKGVHLVSTFKRLKNVNWILSVNTPIEHSYASIHTAITYWTIGLCSVIFFLVLIMWFVMQYMTAPLLSLTNNVLSLDINSDTMSLPELRGRDEISLLNDAFNQLLMTINMQKNNLI